MPFGLWAWMGPRNYALPSSRWFSAEFTAVSVTSSESFLVVVSFKAVSAVSTNKFPQVEMTDSHSRSSAMSSSINHTPVPVKGDMQRFFTKLRKSSF